MPRRATLRAIEQIRIATALASGCAIPGNAAYPRRATNSTTLHPGASPYPIMGKVYDVRWHERKSPALLTPGPGRSWFYSGVEQRESSTQTP